MSLCVLSFAVVLFSSFFFTVPATTGIYTLSLHDALPIYPRRRATGALGKSHQLAAGLVVAHDMIQTCDAVERGARGLQGTGLVRGVKNNLEHGPHVRFCKLEAAQSPLLFFESAEALRRRENAESHHGEGTKCRASKQFHLPSLLRLRVAS